MTKDQERVNTSKFNIRQALSSAGVNVPVDTPLDEYPPYIMGVGGITSEWAEVSIASDIPELIFFGVVSLEPPLTSGRIEVYPPSSFSVKEDSYIYTYEDLSTCVVSVTGDITIEPGYTPDAGKKASIILPGALFHVIGDGTITITKENN